MLAFLNGNAAEFRGRALNSPRAVGDIAQELSANNFQTFVAQGDIAKYTQEFARRAMADLAFEDSKGCYY